ncbi:MAG: hypothetical protein Q3M24_23240 [Candidatus Electrothrix aestuarii]|uniref:Uncharacterized protein n=1 Tax=Candidatus Electrothrix aestuarii TaxID=3062594 RepID=A0AAU8LV33_9BACT|nr:hypothetical protein [Candidatus Electrothrix aestuarii]
MFSTGRIAYRAADSFSCTNKRTFDSLSSLFVVLLISSFFPNFSNNNVKIGLVGQMTCLPPAKTKIFLSGNVRRNTDNLPVYTCINATLTAEAITEEAEGDSFFQHIKTERSGSAYII